MTISRDNLAKSNVLCQKFAKVFAQAVDESEAYSPEIFLHAIAQLHVLVLATLEEHGQRNDPSPVDFSQEALSIFASYLRARKETNAIE